MIVRVSISSITIGALILLCAMLGAAQTDKLVAQILAENTVEERRLLLKNRSEPELIELVNNLLAESETKPDSKECGKILEIARFTAETINYKVGLAKAVYRTAILNINDNSPQMVADSFAQAVKLMEESGNRMELAKLIDAMGFIHVRMAEYDRALNEYHRSLGLFEELGETEATARTFDSMGAIYMLRGDYTAAEMAHSRSLQIAVARKDLRNIANATFHLAIVQRLRGNYGEALRLYQQSLKSLEALATANPILRETLATNLRHIGGTYFLQGNLRLANDYAAQALAIDEAISNRESTAHTLQFLARIRFAEKKYREAQTLAERALPIFEELGMREAVAGTLATLGITHSALGNYEIALNYFQRSLKIRDDAGSRDGAAFVRIGMANALNEQGKYREAIELASLAIESARSNGNRELLWQAQAAIARAQSLLDECDIARTSFDAAIATIENLRGEVVGGASESSLFFAEKVRPYQQLAAMLAGEGDYAESFEYAERAKARVLLDAVRFGRNHQTATMSSVEKAEENKLRGDVNSLNAQISRLAQPGKEKLAVLNPKLEAARAALARFQTNLYAVHPELRIKRGAVKPVAIDEIGNLLTEKSALLEYLVSDDAVLLYVFTKSNDRVQFKTYKIAVGREELNKRIERFRQKLATRNVLFGAEAHAGYELLLRPAAAQLVGKTNLVIVPDDGLWELPFQALQSAENRYVLDDVSVSYSPSMTTLREMRANPRKVSSSELKIVAFGNPTTGAERMSVNFKSLPEAERQTNTLKTLNGAGNVRVFNRKQADETVLKQESANGFSILHLATHGVLDNNSPLNSYVLLAPNQVSGDDGRLEAWEILEMNLSSDLVFLSACETARGGVRSGEGLIGLSWSFMIAGARNVVVSQWKVESSSTTDLTIDFYKRLKQNVSKKPEALRQAALKLRRNSATSHPFYWAGFVLIGEAE